MNTNQTATLTAALFDDFLSHADFGGWGYVGERDRYIEFSVGAGDDETVAKADALALSVANAQGWTVADLFTWANSKDGRRFADCTLGCGEFDHRATRYVRRQS